MKDPGEVEASRRPIEMDDLYVKNSFCDLNVVIQEGKKANNDMLQMLGDCEQKDCRV